MSTRATQHAGAESFWQKTIRASFLGRRVRVRLRAGGYLEGELKNPQATYVTLEQLAGATKLIEYGEVREIEESR